MKSLRTVTVLSCVLLFLFSCGRASEKSVTLPANPPLSGGLGWAVISDSYVRLKSEPREAAADLAYLRDKTLAEVRGREREKDGATESGAMWYHLRLDEGEGWVRGDELLLYSSREQAERALKGGE